MYLKKSLPYNKNSGHKHVMNVQIIKFTFFHLRHYSNLRYSHPVSYVVNTSIRLIQN